MLSCLNVSDKKHGSSASAHVQVVILKHRTCVFAGEVVCRLCSQIGISGIKLKISQTIMGIFAASFS